MLGQGLGCWGRAGAVGGGLRGRGFSLVRCYVNKCQS